MTPAIAVAVSGGVDSLAAAWLIKRYNHHVIGVHFTTGYGTSDQRRLEAMTRAIGIDFEVVNLTAQFKSTVVDYFIDAYRRGKTPNPCLVCNPAIKFGVLLDHVTALGATRLATGHYARIAGDDTKGYRLLKGMDHRKDQSYFLAFTKPERLGRMLFPLGDMTKTSVRALAEREGLVPAEGDESQDVCFIRGGYHDFLRREGGLSVQPGPITDTAGKIIGRHDGLYRYTVGQRRGIGVPAPEPYYVIRLEPDGNRLVVGRREELYRKACVVTGLNWIRKPVTSSFEASVRLRYRHRAVDARVNLTDGREAHVRFAEPQAAVTPGQGAVFYQDEEVLGGGWITARRDSTP